jgi:methionine-rich copper-binding protein CopC
LPPTITGIYPSRGPITGGTRVQIAGSSFPAYGGPDIQLSIGDVKSAAGCGYGSCFFETPPAPRSGKVHIIATAFGGSSTPSPTDLFEYTDYPELTEFHVPDLSSADRSEASISLNGNAPAGGAAIALTSDKPGVVGVPQIVTILGSSVAVPLTLLPTPKDETVSLTATYQGTSATATLNVAAWPPISLFLNPLDNAHADVTITISTFAQTGGAAISLQTSDPSALSLPVPPRVTIPAGSYKATFPIISHPSAHIVGGNVVFNPKSVTISASYPGGTASLSTSVPFRLLCQQRKCASGFYWNQKDCRCDPGPPQ